MNDAAMRMTASEEQAARMKFAQQDINIARKSRSGEMAIAGTSKGLLFLSHKDGVYTLKTRAEFVYDAEGKMVCDEAGEPVMTCETLAVGAPRVVKPVLAKLYVFVSAEKNLH